MLDSLWQVFALIVCVGAFGLVMWDFYLREARAARAKALGVVAIGLVLLGGWALAAESVWWLPAVGGSLAVYALSRRAGSEQRSE